MEQAAGIVFVTASGKVLLLKRADSGQWCPPAGGVEPGEDAQTAAIREVLEETGYTTQPGLLQLSVVENVEGVQFTGFMQVLQTPFNVVLNDEHTDAQWFNADALPEPLFMNTGDLIALAVQATAVAMDAVDSARIMDSNGWWLITGNPISKAGVYPYAGKNIPGADPNKVYMVLRPPEELGSQATIDSFKLTPWINDHVMLGNGRPNTVPAEQKGVHGVIGEDVYFDNDTLYANIKLWSAQQDATIAAGKTELSSGYRCKYEKASGVYNGEPYDYVQREIRGNHLASVMDGRMGPEVSVMDHFSFTFDAKDAQIMADTKDTPAAGGEGGSGAEPSLADCVAMFKALQPLIPTLMAMGQAAAAGAQPTAQVEDADPAAKPADPATARAAGAAAAADDSVAMDKKVSAMDSAIAGMPSAIFKAIAARDRMAADLSAHVGVFDHSDMTPGDVVAYGIDKLGLKSKATPGAESEFLAGYLAAAKGKTTATARQAVAAMDAADSDTQPEFLANYLAAEKE